METLFRFIVLLLCFTLMFVFGYTYGKMKYKEQLQDKQIQLNICNATIDLFKNDMNKFCEEQFEKMGC